MSQKTTGDLGEEIAAQYLEKKGLRVLDRNYRFSRAEVDLVCFEPAEQPNRGGEIVFVEVKTRHGTGFGHPEDAVTREKQINIIRAARAYLYERKLEGAMCRFDVVSIVIAGKTPEIEHFKNAFDAS